MGHRQVGILTIALLMMTSASLLRAAHDTGNVLRSPDTVAIWGFDEASGTVARDVSGNNNHATQSFAPDFVYSSSVKQYGLSSLHEVPQFSSTNLSAPDSASLHAMANAFTVEGWWRSDTSNFSSLFPTLISRVDDTRPVGLKTAWAIGTSGSGLITATVYDHDSAASITAMSSGVFPINQFVHVAMTFSSGTVTLYVNGVQQGSPLTNAAVDQSGIGRVVIGGFANENGVGLDQHPWRGYLDEIRLSSVALLPGDGSGEGVLAFNSTITPEPATAMLLVATGSGIMGLRRARSRTDRT